PVSVKPAFDRLFARWRETELVPLIADQQREREQAAGRKLEILRSQIEARLRQALAAPEQTSGHDSADAYRSADLALQTAAGRITDLERRLDALTFALPRRASEISVRAAELISDHADSRLALAQAFREVTGEAAQDIGRDLQTLAMSLADVHRQSTQLLNASGSDAAESLEAAATVREVPVPELPPDIVVPAQGAERILGRGMARSIVARRLDHAAGDAIRSTLDSYAAVLRRWALDRLDVIRAQWTAATDGVRADIDRRMGHAQERTIDRTGIRTDLDRVSVSALP
ncbi:MAG: hypothetical protein DMF98_03445, partial [Acidobacteria bacterium]